jgi:CSLREA domain-containing protein
MRAFCRILLTGVVLAATAATAHGATIPVTTTADALAGDGQCSLREAVLAARLNTAVLGCPAGAPTGEDTIGLAAATYVLTLAGAREDGGATGDLDVGGVGQTTRIAGLGSGATAIDAAGLDRAFDVLPTSALVLEDLAVRGGAPPTPEVGSGDAGADGAGVHNFGSLIVRRILFTGNRAGSGARGTSGADPGTFSGGAGGSGGAIWSGGSQAPRLVVIDSTFTANLAGAGGRGLRGGDGGNAGRGGAIAIDGGTAEISGSTFSANVAGPGGDSDTEDGFAGDPGTGGGGGAISLSGGTSSVSTSTFSGNSGGAGGRNTDSGLQAFGGDAGAVHDPMGVGSVEYATFAGNLRGAGSQGANGIQGGRVAASILADPAPACVSITASLLRNVALAGDPSCAGPRLDGDPRLGPLADNGGPTPTMLPGPGSVAINALAGAPCPGTDQRGLPRPQVGACDAGAVEIQAGAPGAPPPGGAGGLTVSGTIAGLTLSPATFRATGRKRLGTNVSFRLGAAGTVVITVRRPAAGKRSKARCLAPTRALRAARSCTRQITLPGKLTRRGVAGVNVIRFSGKLRGRALSPGRYTLVVTLPRAGSSPAVTAVRAFRIAR